MSKFDYLKDFKINVPKFNFGINMPIFKGPTNIDRMLDGLRASMLDWARVLQGTVDNPAAKEELRLHGILPHKSTPWNLFDPNNPRDFSSSVLSYYSNEWEQARGVFLEDVNSYQIGREAKDAFIEGIDCHTNGLYRATVLTVLPTAEAEFRRTFKIGPKQQAASLKELRSAIDNAPAGVMLDHVAPFDLYRKLNKHLYEKVNTESDVERLNADPIPNRHAAIHGLVHYKSAISSLNALIMTDYVFFLITQISENLEPAE